MNPLLAKLLELRGITDEREVEEFFNPSLAALAKPEELPGVPEAVEAILAALKGRRRIVVFGDYDCDGVCATAILTSTLRTLEASVMDDLPEPHRELALKEGTRVSTFLPKRLTEGYGMSDDSVARLLEEVPDVALVVTVDNGINSIAQVAQLTGRGVEVVVTDHHLPSVNAFGKLLLPNASAVVNPKVNAPAHLSELCGAAVAFLLANALVSTATERGMYSGEKVGGPLLVLAGLATVTDVMPVLGQNRILVAEALRRFHSWAPIGLKELYQRASRTTAPVLTTKDFGFLIGPRINAAGRVASGEESLELILTTDREIAREAARIVDGRNVERKQIEGGMVDEALKQLRPGAAAQIIDIPDGHQGVAGIVAARIMERVKVPTGVIAGGHGSARAPEGYNVRDALQACSKYLTRYGGHAAAAGFSVKDGCIEAFRDAFAAECAKQREQWLATRQTEASAVSAGGLEYDLEVAPADLTLEFAQDLARMEPFGEGNPEPKFLFRHVFFEDVRPLGQDAKHLAFTVNGFKAVWWGHGDLVEELHTTALTARDLVFTVEISTYGGAHVELRPVEIIIDDGK